MKILKKLSIGMILIVSTISCYGKNKNVEIMIPINNGDPKIENVFIDLDISYGKFDPTNSSNIYRKKRTFINKVKTEFQKNNPKLNLLSTRPDITLNIVHLLPREKQQKAIKELSSLGVIKVYLVYFKDSGSYYAEVKNTVYDISIYNSIQQKSFAIGTAKSLDKILFGIVYDLVLKKLKKTNNHLIRRNDKNANNNEPALKLIDLSPLYKNFESIYTRRSNR